MTSKKIKLILGIVCYYLLPLALTTTFFVIFGHDLKKFSIILGVWSLNLLLLILFVKPFSVLFPKIPLFKTIRSWRRELGVAAFYLALFHTVGLFMTTNLWSYPKVWLYGFSDPVFFGTASLVIMFFLYLTSNNFSVSKLKRNWKKLHYLVYPALLLALMHKFGVEHGNLIPAFVVFTVFATFKFFEFRKKRINK